MSDTANETPLSPKNNPQQQPATQEVELPVLNQNKETDKPTESGCCGACGG